MFATPRSRTFGRLTESVVVLIPPVLVNPGIANECTTVDSTLLARFGDSCLRYPAALIPVLVGAA